MRKKQQSVPRWSAGSYDVAVIGGGHAGCEAALAAARLGCSTIVFAINLDSIANMPCNPNIGGTAKGHLVREVDALGGEMGKVADRTLIQSRMLNAGKGPAVHSLRAQIDRRAYGREMKRVLENQPGLHVRQGEVTDILFEEDGRVSGVVLQTGAVFRCRAAIIASGTYLKGNIIIGELQYSGGPDGMFPADSLSGCLREAGIELMRFKTGTPARVSRQSIDFSGLAPQEGDEEIVPFSFEETEKLENKVVCYLTHTNPTTHDIIRRNLDRSPLFAGMIEGIGPRYCPSIEDKVVRFADKQQHQVFLEPMGLATEEIYVQGMSSSLPEEVQIEMMRSMKGLEHVQIMRPAYAIEYDCCNPLQLRPTLEFKSHEGLYGAGQFNGTSGYEEAAAQGLIAGINAARKLQGKDPVILERSDAYIGTLIDDLVSKGTREPYRMMTSRSEYRLLLRQDNADERLTPLGHEIGLISDERYQRFLDKWASIRREVERLKKTTLAPSERVNAFLASKHSTPLTTGIKLADLLRRPELSYPDLTQLTDMPDLPKDVWEEAAIQVKYEGYISRQIAQVAQFRKLENKKLPEDLDYTSLKGLRLEARQKLQQVRPLSVGQASRISGVSPADITALLIHLEQKKGADKAKET